MAHIHTGDNEHDLTATAYIARIENGKPHGLLHMHRKLNILLPVGGHVEVSETPWQAIAHELKEESGYDISQLQVVQPPSRIRNLSKVVQHPQPLSLNTHAISPTHYHTDLQYGFVTTELPAHTIDEGEATDIRWVDEAEMDLLSAAEIYDNTKEVYKFLFEVALKEWELVPTETFLLDFPEEFKA